MQLSALLSQPTNRAMRAGYKSVAKLLSWRFVVEFRSFTCRSNSTARTPGRWRCLGNESQATGCHGNAMQMTASERSRWLTTVSWLAPKTSTAYSLIRQSILILF